MLTSWLRVSPCSLGERRCFGPSPDAASFPLRWAPQGFPELSVWSRRLHYC